MHKMAFHRARVLSILECTLAERGERLPVRGALPPEETLLSKDVAPDMRPSRADVFLPYTLPGEI